MTRDQNGTFFHELALSTSKASYYPLALLCGRLSLTVAQSHFIFDAPDIDKRAALHICAERNGHSLAKALLKFGANPNLPDHHFSTPLHTALRLGNDALASLLLDFGADPRLLNRSGKSTRDFARTDEIKNRIDQSLASFESIEISRFLGPAQSKKASDSRL